MSLKGYIFSESTIAENEVIREITWQEYKAIDKVLKGLDGRSLSFYDTFDQDKRIAVPFKSTSKSEIQELVDFIQENGYELDFEEGTISKEFTIPAGPKKGEKSKKSTRIGKFLQKVYDITVKFNKNMSASGDAWMNYSRRGADEKDKKAAEGVYKKLVKDGIRLWGEIRKVAPALAPDDEKPRESERHWAKPADGWGEKGPPMNPWTFYQVINGHIKGFIEFWNKKSEYYRKNPKEAFDDSPKHTIIISRHPVDVLRMSDFSHITSCHSPPSRGGGGSYYQCARAEAQGHGLVAYLIDNRELPEDFDLKDYDELFSDAKRDIPGLTPMARVRLRKFIHNETGKEIAVPETAVYGNRVPGFVEAVVKWAREQRSFKELFGDLDDPPDLDDFIRYGGSYGDSKDGEIFNKLVGKDIYDDWDNTTHEEDDEEEDVAEQYAERAEQIEDRYNGRYDHSHISYEVEGDGEDAYVLFSGGMTVELKGQASENLPSTYRELSSIASELQDLLNEADIYMMDEIDIEESYDGSGINIEIRANTGNYEPNPDGFESFAMSLESELDDEYDKIFKVCKEYFLEKGYLEPSDYDKLRASAQDLEDTGNRMFQFFEVEVNEDDIDFTTEKPFYISLRGFEQSEGEQKVKKLLDDSKARFLEKIEAGQYLDLSVLQMDLPGVSKTPRRQRPVSFEALKQFITMDLKFQIPEKYKEMSLASMEMTITLTQTNRSQHVRSMLAYIRWMDKHVQKTQQLLQKAYDEVALEQGLHPELKRSKANIAPELGKVLTKNQKEYEELQQKFPDMFAAIHRDTKVVFDVSYLDLGDYIFINSVASTPPGSSLTMGQIPHDGGYEALMRYGNFWFQALLNNFKNQYSKFGRNLLIPVESFEGMKSLGSDMLEAALEEKTTHWFKWKATQSTGYGWDAPASHKQNVNLFDAYPFLKGKVNPKIKNDVYGVKFEFLRESLMFGYGKMLFESDAEIDGLVSKLARDEKARELVRLMKPLDVAKIVAVNLDLQPKKACKTALNLLQQVHNVHYEGMASPGIESNKEFPVPPTSKKNKPKLWKFKETAYLSKPFSKTDITPKFTIEPHQWAPDPYDREKDEEWPYDDMTTAGMKPGTKDRKRPLTTAKDNSDGRSWKQKGNPLNPDLKVRQPGGDGAGGGGVYRLTYHSRTGDMPGAGNNSWVARGTKGWNSMPGAEFESPDDENNQPKDLKKKPPTGEAMGGGSVNVNPKSQNAGDEDEEEPKFLKNPPVGSSIPSTNYGGRTPAQPAGYRNWMKK
jgi:hypothetical protein